MEHGSIDKTEDEENHWRSTYAKPGGSSDAVTHGVSRVDVGLLQKKPVSKLSHASSRKDHSNPTGVMPFTQHMIDKTEKASLKVKMDEEQAQKEYQNIHSRVVSKLGGPRKRRTSALQNASNTLQSGVTATSAASKVSASRYQDCGWLMENFDARKQVRTGEVDASNIAKALLSGEGFSL